jgi:hypothetical protein
MITDLGDTLRHWPQFVLSYREQIPLGGIALSPPGLVVVYDTFRRFFATFPGLATTFDSLVRPLECQNPQMMAWNAAQMASAWFQMFMPLWAALGVAPLYRLGSYLFDKGRARLAVALWPLVPGMAIFTPRFNVFYPLITLVMLLALWRGLSKHRFRQILLAGFVLSVGIFLNLSLVPLGLLAGLFILGYALLNREPVIRPSLNLVMFGAGCASFWLVYWVLSGVSPLDILNQGMSLHLILNRPYLPWLFMHPYDMFLFVGLPVSALVLWRIWRLRKGGKMGAQLLTGAGALALLILVLSGTARGETGRVWLFFAPVWVLLAADVLAGFRQGERAHILAMQALCLLSMMAVLRANFTTLTVPPFPPAADRAATFPVNARFALESDAVTLTGLDVEATPSTVTLRLHWRADSYVHGFYVLGLTSVAPDGSSGPNVNWNSINPTNPPKWDYPPSCWLPGHEFVNTVEVPLGDKPLPGNWLFSLSIADVATRQAMPVTGQDGKTSMQVGIGPVNVPAH